MSLWMNRGIKRICFISMLFIFVAVLYTYPLAFNLSSMTSGFSKSDTPLFIWNIWHIKNAIFSNYNFFNTNYIFYPQRPSLILHTYTITTGLMSLPFQYFFEPIVSGNLIFIIQFVLTGLGTYFLVFFFTNNKIAALWSSLTLAFCPYVIIRSLYYFNISTIWFFPWFIYFLWKFLDSGRLRFCCLAAIVYALCLLNDQTYFIFLTILMLLMFLFFLLTRRKLPFKTYIKDSIVGFIIFIILVFPYLIALITKIMTTRAELQTWSAFGINYFSLHPHNLLLPPPILSVYRKIPYLCVPMTHITNVFVGYIPLFFAFFALVNLKNISHEKRKIITFWLITGIIFFLIALGPLPFGKNRLLNKFSLYTYLCSGFLKQLRIPVRFSFVSLIAIYIIAAFGVERFVKLNKGRFLNNVSLCVFLIILQIIEFFPIPYPLLNLKVPGVYRKLALRDKDSPILVLPLGWQSGYKTLGTYDKRIQFYQTIHGHPIFQGQISRIEDSYFNYYIAQEAFTYLLDADKRMPTSSERKDVHNILREYNIKYIVIHRSYFDTEHLNVLLKILKEYSGELFVEFTI